MRNTKPSLGAFTFEVLTDGKMLPYMSGGKPVKRWGLEHAREFLRQLENIGHTARLKFEDRKL